MEVGVLDNPKDKRIELLEKENKKLRRELESLREADNAKREKIAKSLRKKITVRGVTYGSRKEAADALGVTINTVASAKQNGRLDTLGTGKPSLTPEARRKAWDSNRKTIKFQGCTFSGWAEAKHVTGMSRQAMLRNGATVLP